MCYIWHTNIDGQIVIHEDAIKLIPVLAYFEEKYIKYIILYYDYRLSPIKDFPSEQRYKISKLKAGFLDSDNLIDDNEIITAASEYTSLIYDDRRETKRTLQNNIDQQRRKISNGVKDLKELKETMEFIKFFEMEINRIDTKLSAEDYDDDPEIKGDKKISYVEKWVRRRKKYLSMMTKNEY